MQGRPLAQSDMTCILTGTLQAQAQWAHVKGQVSDDQAPLLHVQPLAGHLPRPHQRPRARAGFLSLRRAGDGLQHAVVQLRDRLQRALHLQVATQPLCILCWVVRLRNKQRDKRTVADVELPEQQVSAAQLPPGVRTMALPLHSCRFVRML